MKVFPCQTCESDIPTYGGTRAISSPLSEFLQAPAGRSLSAGPAWRGRRRSGWRPWRGSGRAGSRPSPGWLPPWPGCPGAGWGLQESSRRRHSHLRHTQSLGTAGSHTEVVCHQQEDVREVTGHSQSQADQQRHRPHDWIMFSARLSQTCWTEDVNLLIGHFITSGPAPHCVLYILMVLCCIFRPELNAGMVQLGYYYKRYLNRSYHIMKDIYILLHYTFIYTICTIDNILY